MPANRSMLIIANPTSGKGRGRRTATGVALALRKRGIDVEIQFTGGNEDAEKFADQACRQEDRPSTIVACGGDGTIQQVVNAVAPFKNDLGDRCPFVGLAPAGRCNDFARVFGISAGIEGIAETLIWGGPISVDLGRIGDRYYCTVATVGVDAEISSYVDTMRMPIRGTLAYIYGTLCVLLRYRGRQVKLAGDFGEVNQRVFLASSANTSSYGGSIKIAPHAKPTDGKLDLCLIDDISWWRSLMLLGRVLFGRHTTLPEVRFLQTESVHVDSDESLELWADGECVGHTPIDISVVPGAIQLIVPQAMRGNGKAAIRGQWT